MASEFIYGCVVRAVVLGAYFWGGDHLLQLSGALKQDAFSQLWALVKGAIALHPTTFQSLQNQPHSLLAALSIVFIAGFAQSVDFGAIFCHWIRLLGTEYLGNFKYFV